MGRTGLVGMSVAYPSGPILNSPTASIPRDPPYGTAPSWSRSARRTPPQAETGVVDLNGGESERGSNEAVLLARPSTDALRRMGRVSRLAERSPVGRFVQHAGQGDDADLLRVRVVRRREFGEHVGALVGQVGGLPRVLHDIEEQPPL